MISFTTTQPYVFVVAESLFSTHLVVKYGTHYIRTIKKRVGKDDRPIKQHTQKYGKVQNTMA